MPEGEPVGGKVMAKYCKQNLGNCEICALTNYGRDCRNNPVGSPENMHGRGKRPVIGGQTDDSVLRARATGQRKYPSRVALSMTESQLAILDAAVSARRAANPSRAVSRLEVIRDLIESMPRYAGQTPGGASSTQNQPPECAAKGGA